MIPFGKGKTVREERIFDYHLRRAGAALGRGS